MKKLIQYSATVLLTLGVGSTVFAQGYGSKSTAKQPGDVIAVTVDSIESDMGYIMITVMSDNFEPFDYQMRPSKHGKMVIEMRKPAGEMPFSIMAFEDANMNHRLDLNEKGIPCEKSVAKHCRGDESEVTVTLRHYDRLLGKSSVPADTVQTKPKQ